MYDFNSSAATNPDGATRDGKVTALVLDGAPRALAERVVDLEDRVARLTEISSDVAVDVAARIDALERAAPFGG